MMFNSYFLEELHTFTKSQHVYGSPVYAQSSTYWLSELLTTSLELLSGGGDSVSVQSLWCQIWTPFLIFLQPYTDSMLMTFDLFTVDALLFTDSWCLFLVRDENWYDFIDVSAHYWFCLLVRFSIDSLIDLWSIFCVEKSMWANRVVLSCSNCKWLRWIFLQFHSGFLNQRNLLSQPVLC